MRRIRVLWTEIPSALDEMFKRTLAVQPDMEIVGELSGPSDPMEVLLAANQTQADAVVLGLQDSELPGVCSHLISEYPLMKILAVTADGRQAFMYGLRAEMVPIREMSPQTMVDAIRAAVRAPMV